MVEYKTDICFLIHTFCSLSFTAFPHSRTFISTMTSLRGFHMLLLNMIFQFLFRHKLFLAGLASEKPSVLLQSFCSAFGTCLLFSIEKMKERTSGSSDFLRFYKCMRPLLGLGPRNNKEDRTYVLKVSVDLKTRHYLRSEAASLDQRLVSTVQFL